MSNPWPSHWPYAAQYLLALGVGCLLAILLLALASWVRDKRRGRYW